MSSTGFFVQSAADLGQSGENITEVDLVPKRASNLGSKTREVPEPSHANMCPDIRVDSRLSRHETPRSVVE